RAGAWAGGIRLEQSARILLLRLGLDDYRHADTPFKLGSSTSKGVSIGCPSSPQDAFCKRRWPPAYVRGPRLPSALDPGFGGFSKFPNARVAHGEAAEQTHPSGHSDASAPSDPATCS